MMNDRLSKALVALFAVAAVGACDDPPIEPGDNEAARLSTNPSFVVIEAGDSRVVTAFLVNDLGNPVTGAVTFTACNAGISVAADTAQTDVEPGSNFVITGNTLGASCVNVSGAGFEETVQVRVVPAGISLTAGDTLLSGTNTPASVVFLNVGGTAVTGFDTDDVTFTSLDEDVAEIDSAGNVTAKAPGTVEIAVVLNAGLGAPRGDTITVVVVPGDFSGTATPSSGSAGAEIDVESGASDPAFDESTSASITMGFSTYPLFQFTSSDGNTFVTQIPYNLPVGTGTMVFAGLGEDEVALAEEWEVTATTTNDPFEPNNVFDGTPATPATLPIELVALTNGSDPDDLYQITVADETEIDLFMDWDNVNGSGDLDLLIVDVAAFAFVSCFGAATGSHPEETSCTLPAGTYWIWVNNYGAEHGGSQADTNYYLRVTEAE